MSKREVNKDVNEIEALKMQLDDLSKQYQETLVVAVEYQKRLDKVRESTVREVAQLLRDETKSRSCKFSHRSDANRIAEYIEFKFLPKREGK